MAAGDLNLVPLDWPYRLSHLPSPNKALHKVLLSLATRWLVGEARGDLNQHHMVMVAFQVVLMRLNASGLFTPRTKPQKQEFACGLIISFLDWNRKSRLAEFSEIRWKYPLRMIFYAILKTVALTWFLCQNHLHKIDVSHGTLTEFLAAELHLIPMETHIWEPQVEMSFLNLFFPVL